MADTAPGYGYGGDKKLCARIDISSAKQVSEVNLGDEITITIKGKVRRLDGPEQFMSTEYAGKGKEKEVARKLPGSVELDISSMTVMGADGAFDGMTQDGDE